MEHPDTSLEWNVFKPGEVIAAWQTVSEKCSVGMQSDVYEPISFKEKVTTKVYFLDTRLSDMNKQKHMFWLSLKGLSRVSWNLLCHRNFKHKLFF